MFQSLRPSRRRFLRWAGASVAALAVPPAYAWRIEPHWVQVVRRAMPIANLPAALVGRTLVQISDLHVGTIVDPDYLHAALDHVSALAADFVVVTGDYMTCGKDEQIDNATRALKHLAPGRLGSFAILGNHDYGESYNHERTADLISERLRDHGFTVLRNEKAVCHDLVVAGIDDLWGPNFRPEKVLPTLDPRQANLVLVHNPDAVDLKIWNGYRGWILSGHTHGGQCCAPVFGPPFLPVVNRRYTSGEFDLYDGRRLYINPGLGYLRRIRFNVPPEITLFTLTQA